MKNISIASVFIKQIIEGATQQGIDCQPILLRNGVSALSIDKPGTRVSLQGFAAVALDIMKELDDEFLGLAQKKQRLGSFNMMCRAGISAKTVKRSMQQSAHFWNLFENTFTSKVLVSSGKIYYQISLQEGHHCLNDYLWFSALSSMHRFHCWLAGQYLPLNSVCFPLERPEYATEIERLFYNSPIKYGQPMAEMEMDIRYANIEIVQTPETLETYLADSNLSLLYQPRQYRIISDQVRHWLEKNLRQGNYYSTIKQAAAHLQISQQVLHRRLQSENTSFKEIKMQTRRDIAINLLCNSTHRVEEIATLVGFSEPSAFIRAFRSWTDTTPLHYRQTAAQEQT
ncbi:MAG: AraC family transcriptional regulator [Pseudomonadota bacterium]